MLRRVETRRYVYLPKYKSTEMESQTIMTTDEDLLLMDGAQTRLSFLVGNFVVEIETDLNKYS